MTAINKLTRCLSAAVLAFALAGIPAAAFADDAAPAGKGIIDQFSAFDDSLDDAARGAQDGEDADDGSFDENDGAADDAATEADDADDAATGAADADAADEDAADADAADAGEETYEGVTAGVNAEGAWQDEAAPSDFVFDERSLFSQSEKAALEALAKSLADQYGIGVYFLTTGKMNGLDNPTSDERTRFATGYYMEHSLGMGSGKDGILFVLARDSRDYVTVAYGAGSYRFSNEGISSMEDDVKECLSDSEWFQGAQTYYDDIGGQLSYYASHGKPGKPLGIIDYLIRFGLIILLPLIIALAVTGGWKSAMKTARKRTEAGDYLDQASLVLTASTDQFINSSVVATPRHQESSSGGGGGGWGGGGGGGFSSSGGGKF